MANKVIKIFKLSVVIFVLVVFAQGVQAHLDGGEDKTIGNYLIDFRFSPEKPKVGDKTTLSFNLLDKGTKAIIEPTSVWIRVSSSREVVFAGTFYPEAKHVVLTYVFPEADMYEITARFKQNSNILAETFFQLEVTENVKNQFSPSIGHKITFLLGTINIIILLLIFFSCRCLVGSKFIKTMLKYRWYQKYYKLHCYYWWIFFVSIILHTVFAVSVFGNPL